MSNPYGREGKTHEFLPRLALNPESSQPLTLEDAVAYTLTSGMRAITDYDGYRELQEERAGEIASRLFFPGSDFREMLQEYESLSTSAERMSDDDICLRVVAGGLERQRLRVSEELGVAPEQLAKTVLLRQTTGGEAHINAQFVVKGRSLGN